MGGTPAESRKNRDEMKGKCNQGDLNKISFIGKIRGSGKDRKGSRKEVPGSYSVLN